MRLLDVRLSLADLALMLHTGEFQHRAICWIEHATRAEVPLHVTIVEADEWLEYHVRRDREYYLARRRSRRGKEKPDAR